MSMAEAGRPIVDWSPRDDAHSGLRHTDRPAARPTGRVQHGYNRVQEIVSDTITGTVSEGFLFHRIQPSGSKKRTGLFPTYTYILISLPKNSIGSSLINRCNQADSTELGSTEAGTIIFPPCVFIATGARGIPSES